MNAVCQQLPHMLSALHASNYHMTSCSALSAIIFPRLVASLFCWHKIVYVLAFVLCLPQKVFWSHAYVLVSPCAGQQHS